MLHCVTLAAMASASDPSTPKKLAVLDGTVGIIDIAENYLLLPTPLSTIEMYAFSQCAAFEVWAG